jgi:ATP-dependent Clp protease ATP-binding subunit ClpC
MLGRGEAPLPSQIKFTPRTAKVLGLALDEARGLQQPVVGTEHLLLAIAHEGEGIAAAALELSGISLEQVHTQVMRMVAST